LGANSCSTPNLTGPMAEPLSQPSRLEPNGFATPTSHEAQLSSFPRPSFFISIHNRHRYSSGYTVPTTAAARPRASPGSAAVPTITRFIQYGRRTGFCEKDAARFRRGDFREVSLAAVTASDTLADSVAAFPSLDAVVVLGVIEVPGPEVIADLRDAELGFVLGQLAV
jgi:hypothetical protein